MKLFIDACPRKKSRTRELAEALVKDIGEYEVIHIEKGSLPALNDEMLEKRNADCSSGIFTDPAYKYAKQFAEAEEIVIAAPFWDLSFPSVLKDYIECICVTGITFRYSEEGIPVGLCKGKMLHYVTTSGGPIYDSCFCFGYIKALAEGMFGIKDCRFYSAENLDIVGNDPDEILRKAKEKYTMI